MKITDKVLQKIEDKTWEDLESVNGYERQLIKNKSTIKHNINHFSDSQKYIIYIDILQNLKHLINDDKTYIEYYGLEEIETEKETEEHKTRKTIEALKKEYQNDLDDLLTESIPNNNESLYKAQLFATAHYLESGIDTLNILEQKLED